MPSPAEEPFGILFSDVARLFWRRLEAALAAAGYDYTSAEMRVLSTVVDREGLRQSVLAERLHIEPMTLVAHLDRLTARGHVERRPDEGDRRAKLIFATEAGREMLARLREVSAAVRAAPTTGLSPRDIAILRRLLVRVRANLAVFPGAPE